MIFILSLLAIAISSYTLWDNKFRFKLVVAAGRQIKLHVAHLDKGKVKPCIFLNLALLNVGGKSGYLSDIKLRVSVVSNGKIFFDEEFEAIREFDTTFKDAPDIKQSEVLPIVLAGKTAANKGYVFVTLKPIAQDQIPKSFDIEI